MLPLAVVGQLSTSGIGKAVPSAMCKLIWSFVMEHNAAKIIKAALYVHGLTPRFTAFSDNNESRWDFADVYFFGSKYNTKKGHDSWTARMNEMIEDGERHAPPRPSGSLANPIRIVDLGDTRFDPICIQ